jgi:hypothetical protein
LPRAYAWQLAAFQDADRDVEHHAG